MARTKVVKRVMEREFVLRTMSTSNKVLFATGVCKSVATAIERVSKTYDVSEKDIVLSVVLCEEEGYASDFALYLQFEREENLREKAKRCKKLATLKERNRKAKAAKLFFERRAYEKLKAKFEG